MQFRFQIRMICATSDEFLGIDANRQTYPTSGREDGKPITAAEYPYSRNGCICRTERHCTITAHREVCDFGIAPLNAMMSVFEDSKNLYANWMGIRSGRNYQLLLFVYMIGDESLDRYVEAVQGVLRNYDLVFEIDQEEVDHSNTPIVKHGMFDVEGPFHESFIDHGVPQKRYHRCYDDETELHTVEKYTDGCDWVSWEKFYSQEGDLGQAALLVLEILSVLFSLGTGVIRWCKIEREKRIIQKMYTLIREKYGYDSIYGYLSLKKKNAMNNRGKRVYIFEDKRGNTVYSEFEVEVASHRIKQIVFCKGYRWE